MKEILPFFPLAAVTDTGASLDVAMDRFLETEERGDLKILGRAYVLFMHTFWIFLTLNTVIQPALRKERHFGQCRSHSARFVKNYCVKSNHSPFHSHQRHQPLPPNHPQGTIRVVTMPRFLVVQVLKWSPPATGGDPPVNPQIRRPLHLVPNLRTGPLRPINRVV